MARYYSHAIASTFVWSFLTFATNQTILAQQTLDETEQLLAELTNAHGVSGFEGEVRNILRREWRELLPDLHTDGLGNLLGTFPSDTESPRILLMAHMDEVGFLVRYIDENGFIYFHNVGGYFAQSILTQRFSILTHSGRVVGYSGMKSGHILRPTERNQMVPLEKIFIDVGASSREQAISMGIRPGLPIAYETTFVKLGNTGRYLAKAWDDRIGLAVITDALKELDQHPNKVVVAATVQEEIGLRGASVVEESLRPDIVINLEIGIASDFPLMTSPTLSQEALGNGPGIFVYDRSMIPNNNFVEWITETASEQGIPIQFESVSGYGQDGAELQRSATGIPSINIGIPTRYGHSQSGIIDRTDYDNTVKLVRAMIKGLSTQAVQQIRKFE